MNEGATKLSWSALEYEVKERSNDWFWALGVIAVTAALTAIIYNNYFFAALILISAGLLWFFAIKAPDIVTYSLTEKGLKVRSHFYPYENIHTFWLQKEEKPLLFVKTERFFIPVVTIPVEEGLIEEIRDILSEQDIPQEEMKEHPSERIMDTLGF